MPIEILFLRFVVALMAMFFIKDEKLKSSVYIYRVPAITLISAIFILGERITRWGTVGTAFTLLGLILSEYKGEKKNHAEGKE